MRGLEGHADVAEAELVLEDVGLVPVDEEIGGNRGQV
jgi:hypothetical protein